MKLSKGKIILIIIIIFLIISAITSLKTENNDKDKILKEVTIIKDGKLKKENEGKLVLVIGKINSDKKIYFEELDKPLETIKATRIVEDYKKEKNEDGSYSYDWIEREKGYEKTTNLLYTLETETKTNEVHIGEFLLNKEGMNLIKTNKMIHDMENVKGYTFDGLYYSDPEMDQDEPEVGSMRIQYNIHEMKSEYMSILAKQSKDSFKPYKIKHNEYYNVYDGKVINKEQLSKKLDKQIKTDRKGKIIFIILIFALGVFFIKDAKKKN